MEISQLLFIYGLYMVRNTSNATSRRWLPSPARLIDGISSRCVRIGMTGHGIRSMQHDMVRELQVYGNSDNSNDHPGDE